MKTFIPFKTFAEMEAAAEIKGEATVTQGDMFLTVFPGLRNIYRLNGQEIPFHTARANFEHMQRRA